MKKYLHRNTNIFNGDIHLITELSLVTWYVYLIDLDQGSHVVHNEWTIVS